MALERVVKYVNIDTFLAKALLQGFDQIWGARSVHSKGLTWKSPRIGNGNVCRQLDILVTHLVVLGCHWLVGWGVSFGLFLMESVFVTFTMDV